MSRAELPVLSAPSARANREVDSHAALQAALARAVTGEVRFDRLSRALYSTDASVYQILPLGVVLPRTEADLIATVQTCARFGVPLTARGGGTSQAGQAIGPGVVLDCSKYLNRVLEINAAERWARVEPGCILDDLNRALKPLGLHFPHDVSTSDRATLGGMVANNSSGTRSVLYGKTIDHVLELKVVLSDGTLLDLKPLSEAEVEAKCHQQDREGECYRTVRRLTAEHAAEIERRYPKIIRRVGGYNLDAFVPPTPGPSPTKGGGVQESLAPPLRFGEGVGGRGSSVRLPLSLCGRGGGGGEGDPHTFNLAHLLVGSEGTLGVILEAKLRLVELPRAKALLVVHFADLLEALAATPAILAHGPAAVEVIDRYVLDSTRLNPEASRLRDFLHGEPEAILLVEFYGDQPADLPPRLDAVERDLAERRCGYHCHRAVAAEEQACIWKLRKAALGLSMAQKGDAKALSFVEDTAVAPEHLRDYIAEFLAAITRHGTRAGVYAHASVGCLHVRPVVNLKTDEGVRQFEAIAGEVADLVLKYGGALSGEHGDGLVRSPFQEKMFGPALYNAFREIKRCFDPRHLLNPGKIVDAPPLTQNLRYGASYVTPQVPTTFDFAADGGMVQAAELCAGVGACRKKHSGTMCPSYQATCEEQHSTRGRANALRLALTGQLGLKGLTDPALFEVLDLCLECKACKSECPTNVDMARLKAEFLCQYYRKYGLPWRNRLFGEVAALSEFASGLPRLFNWLTRNRLSRWLNEKLLGIDARRLPPALHVGEEFAWQLVARQDYWLPPGVPAQAGLSWVEQWRRAGGYADDPRPRVLLFPDTFTNWYEPGVGLAAAGLFLRLGCRVVTVLPPAFKGDLSAPAEQPVGMRCCGRPLISNGMLDKARSCAESNVTRLYPWAASGKPILACEPSCILTLKDDYPALLRGELRRQAETVAARCRTFEEMAEELASKQDRNLFRPGPKRILVQGHCHQRSLVGMGPTLSLLRRIPGAEVIDLDAGCCGLAGSFGYEKEHYEVSRLVAEQRLSPAVRQEPADTVVLASGFSCRRQIEHFTGRTALHPAELLGQLFCEPDLS